MGRRSRLHETTSTALSSALTIRSPAGTSCEEREGDLPFTTVNRSEPRRSGCCVATMWDCDEPVGIRPPRNAVFAWIQRLGALVILITTSSGHVPPQEVRPRDDQRRHGVHQ